MIAARKGRATGRVSTGEAEFYRQCVIDKLPQPAREYRFFPPRKWRFDFAWPEHMVAVEIEGGVWNGGRHTTGVGFTHDCEKYSTAAAEGWRVIRATTTQVNRLEALAWAKKALS